jgi:hypothetical protein
MTSELYRSEHLNRNPADTVLSALLVSISMTAASLALMFLF